MRSAPSTRAVAAVAVAVAQSRSCNCSRAVAVAPSGREAEGGQGREELRDARVEHRVRGHHLIPHHETFSTTIQPHFVSTKG
jgi:hypothetical protein